MIGLQLHVRIEEAIGPATGGLGRIHREVGVLQEVEQLGAIARRQRDSDAGVAGKLVAIAIERRPQRLVDPRDQRVDILDTRDVVLQDGELVAAEPRDEIVGADRLAQPLRHPLQELIADQMPQRIVDALELVDVDVEDREGLPRQFAQQHLGMVLEQRAVRQIGQRIVMGETFDPLLVAPLLGDVFQCRRPAAVRRPLVDQADGAPVGRRGEGVLHLIAAALEKPGAIRIDVAGERADRLAMQNEIAQMATGLHDVGRHPEHVDIGLIADDQTAGGIEQQQALRHVADRGVEMLALLEQLALRGLVLAAKLANDQEHHGDDDDDGERGREELQSGLRPPVRQHALRPGGCHDQDRKMHQRLRCPTFSSVNFGLVKRPETLPSRASTR